VLNEANEIKCKYGRFIPNYEFESPRKKYRPSLEFFKNGQLYSMYLEKPYEMDIIYPDPILNGQRFKGEMVTFYQNGNIKRLFPYYGKISGYWSEEDEYDMAEYMHINLWGEEYVVKPRCIFFDEDSRMIKSLILGYRDEVVIPTKYGDIKTKVGFSLYEDGKLRTLEPVFGTKIQINGKTYEPFDFYATNIHADNNSMWFDKEGNIIKLKTVRGELVEF
jgi:hypothetical protein